MDRKKCRDASGIPELRIVTPGTTTIGDQVTRDLLAYVVRATAAIYVDSANLARVAQAFDATITGRTMTIAGRGTQAPALICTIHPFEELPTEEPAKIGDGKVLDNHVCTLAQPGSCCHITYEDGSLGFSFLAPTYGMSWCRIDETETCAAWLHAETCVTFFWASCQPPPGVSREIAVWVCSIE